MAALGGVIACQILEGEYGVAKEQLDFLKEIQSTMTAQQTTSGGNNFSKSEILYMSALMGRLTGAPSDQVGSLNSNSGNDWFCGHRFSPS